MQIPTDCRPVNRIAFVGSFGSGKTHMAEWLCKNKGYKKFSFATGLKLIARDFYGISLGGSKTSEARSLYQRLGDAMRSVNKDVFAIRALKEVSIYQCNRRDWEEPKPVVVDDLRFINEASALKNEGFVIIRILPREPITDDTNPLRQHQSETEMSLIEVDCEITSGEYEELEAIVDKPW